MKKALKYILIFFGLQLLAVVPTVIALGNNADKGTAIIIAVAISSLLSCVYFVWNGEVRLAKETFSVRPWTILIPCLLTLFFFFLPEGAMNETLDLPDGGLTDMMESACQTIWGVLVIGVLVPIAEEFAFRGAVLNALLRWDRTYGKPWLAILLSALLFSLMHFNLSQLPFTFLIGLLLGWICWRTGSLLPGIFMHVINNTIVCFAAMMAEEGEPETLAEYFGSPAVEYLVVGVSLLFCIGTVVYLIRIIQTHYPAGNSALQ